MKRLLLVFTILLTTVLAFAGKNDADKWRVMVKKLDVYETASPDSRVIGSYNKFDCPDVKGPRNEKMIGVKYKNTIGYIFEDGMLEPGYMPGSSKFYEAAVEDAIVIQRNNGKIPDGYTLKGMYDVWDNDNENLPIIEQGDATPNKIEDISNNNENWIPISSWFSQHKLLAFILTFLAIGFIWMLVKYPKTGGGFISHLIFNFFSRTMYILPLTIFAFGVEYVIFMGWKQFFSSLIDTVFGLIGAVVIGGFLYWGFFKGGFETTGGSGSGSKGRKRGKSCYNCHHGSRNNDSTCDCRYHGIKVGINDSCSKFTE